MVNVSKVVPCIKRNKIFTIDSQYKINAFDDRLERTLIPFQNSTTTSTTTTTTTTTSTPPTCKEVSFSKTSFAELDDRLIKIVPEETELRITMSFSTRVPDGLILWEGSRQQRNGHWMAVAGEEL